MTRTLLRTIPGTYLAEYLETYTDGTTGVAIISYLWNDSPYDLEVTQ